MSADCNLKNELFDKIASIQNESNRLYKFYLRDLEIRKFCYNCNREADRNNCILFRIYRENIPNIEYKKNELIRLQQDIHNKETEIINLGKKIESLNQKAVNIRANDFLRTTIGEENYVLLKKHEFLDIKGTNNAVYRITKHGFISKIIIKKGLKNSIRNFISKHFSSNHKKKQDPREWHGNISAIHYPMEDAIAIVFMNIIKDSDRFDKDKACGVIKL